MKNLPKLSLRFVDEWAKQRAKVPKKVLIRGYSNCCEGYIRRGRFVSAKRGLVYSPCKLLFVMFVIAHTIHFHSKIFRQKGSHHQGSELQISKEK